MILPTFRLDRLAASYRDDGWWAQDTLDDRFRQGAARGGVALVDGDTRIDYRQLNQWVEALACGLRRRGIGRGDVVAFQLPNWWEAAVVHLATARIGAVSNPLHTIYRQRELAYVLRDGGARVVFAAASFRGHPYADFVREAKASVPHPLDVVEVRGSGGFEQILDETPANSAATQAGPRPDDILLLMYTSGTTAAPKGVLHSHETMLRAGDDLADLFTLGSDDVMFVPSPMTHVTGLLYLQIALGCGMPAVLLDRWDPTAALDLVVREGCTYMGGATPFVQGLVDEARRRRIDPRDVPLTRGTCGGADVPSGLIADVDRGLGAGFVRVYGLTEGVTVTASRPDDELNRRGGSDGHPLPGMQMTIMGSDGETQPAGHDGEIWVRGPANFLGYLNPDHNQDALTPDGWIRTGDLGHVDERGDLHVTGRLKDIIIRGGENISVREVEDLLLEHPLVEQVAVVGMPDMVLGERACAFVVPTDERAPSLEDLVAFLQSKQIAPQKLPERLVVLPDGLPMTPSGKIQKFKLRERIRDLQEEQGV